MARHGKLKRANDVLGPHISRVADTHCTSAMLEIADRCNETCAHCYQEQGNKGEITTADWKRILDDLAELGVLMLTFSGGEATLRRDFLELVEYARERMFMVKVFTNGLNVSQELAERLAELAVHEVQISVYSHRAEVHDWITGVEGSHERTVAGIRHLRKAGIQVLIKTPIFAVNADEVSEYIAFSEALDVHYALDRDVKPRETGDRDPQGLEPSHAQLMGALRHPELAPLVKKLAPRPLESHPCGACRTMTVEANGEVRACAALTVPLGNALEEGVVHSYRDGDTSRFIRRLTWGDLVGCRDCDLMIECARCYSDARFEAGDALKPYASACSGALSARELRLGRPITVEGVHTDPPVGPFRALSDDRVESFEVELTERDRRLREEQPWILHEAQGHFPRAVDTGLVQIRRPGRKQAIGGSLPLAAKP